IIVGRQYTSAGVNHAVVWRSGVLELLNEGPGFVTSWARDISDDGSVIVGTGGSASAAVPFVWTAAEGMQPLPNFLMNNGVTIPPGCTFVDCSAVSGDGRTFAGVAQTGSSYETFVATIPGPGVWPTAVVGLAAVALRRRRHAVG